MTRLTRGRPQGLKPERLIAPAGKDAGQFERLRHSPAGSPATAGTGAMPALRNSPAEINHGPTTTLLTLKNSITELPGA